MNLSFYKCPKCGSLYEQLEGGSSTECCGAFLERIVPNSIDAAAEKHVPVVKYTDEGVTIQIGSEPHPMEDSHYIRWVEIQYDSRKERKYLVPGDKPEASFRVAAKDVIAIASCSLHGLWVSQ